MFRLKFLTAALVAAVAVLAAPATSQAAFKLRLDAGNNGSFETTITDNDANDTNSMVGVIGYSNSNFGGFLITATTGTSKPVLGSGMLGLVSVEVSGAAGTIGIELTDTDYQPALPGSYILSVAGVTSEDPSALSFQAGGTNSNTEFDLTHSTGVVTGNPVGGSSFATGGSFTSGNASPYSLTIRAVITHNSALDNTFFDAELRPAPAPAGLVMLASALPFGGFLLRRLRKPTVPTA